MEENEAESAASSACCFVESLWQGMLGEAEATPSNTSRHRDKTAMVLLAYAIFVVVVGRCCLSAADPVLNAVFSGASTGRRCSEEAFSFLR